MADTPQIVISSESSGRPPPPAGYVWGPDGKLRVDTNVVTDAAGNTHSTTAASPLHEDKYGNQFDADGYLVAAYDDAGNVVRGKVVGENSKYTEYGLITQNGTDKDGNPVWYTSTGAPAQPNGLPVPGSKSAPSEDGSYSIANDHGTYDVYNADGSVRRPGASGPSTYDQQGNITVAGTQAGGPVDNAIGVALTGGGDIIRGTADLVAPGAGDAAGPLLPPTVKDLTVGAKSIADSDSFGNEGLGNLVGGIGDLFGGGGGGGKYDPYVVKQPAPVNATPFTQPLTDLSAAATASGTNWAGQQGDLAKDLLAAPSVAQAAGNAMAERTAQENAAQLASARGANTALLLRQAAGSADARTRGIVSDTAVASAQENVDRKKAAGGLLGQAAGTENAGYQTGVQATGQAGQLGLNAATTNADNALKGEAINASSHDATNATNAGYKPPQSFGDKLLNEGLKAAGSWFSRPSGDSTSSDIRNKQDIHPAPQRFGDMLALASTPEGSRQTLAPVEPAVYEYKPGIASQPGNDGAPRPGVMAQDLMKSPAGDATVVDTPNGKGIDVNRGLSLALASSAGLDKRLAELEAMLGKEDERKRQQASGAQSSGFTNDLRQLGRYSPPRVMMSDERQKKNYLVGP